KDLRRGERDVQEEADRRAGNARAQHLGDEAELVIVNPDEIPRPPHARDGVGEALGDRAVYVPFLRMQRDAIEEIVKERPEDGVREPVVVAAHLDAGEIDRNATKLFEVSVELAPLALGQTRDVARPADPQTTGLLVRATQPGGEAPAAPDDGEVSPIDLDRHRE